MVPIFFGTHSFLVPSRGLSYPVEVEITEIFICVNHHGRFPTTAATAAASPLTPPDSPPPPPPPVRMTSVTNHISDIFGGGNNNYNSGSSSRVVVKPLAFVSALVSCQALCGFDALLMYSVRLLVDPHPGQLDLGQADPGPQADADGQRGATPLISTLLLASSNRTFLPHAGQLPGMWLSLHLLPFYMMVSLTFGYVTSAPIIDRVTRRHLAVTSGMVMALLLVVMAMTLKYKEFLTEG